METLLLLIVLLYGVVGVASIARLPVRRPIAIASSSLKPVSLASRRQATLHLAVADAGEESESGVLAFLKAAGRRCVNLAGRLITQPSFRQELLDMCSVRWLSFFENIRYGEVGRRGEEWLLAQLVLVAFITLGINPLFVICIRCLGFAFSAFGAYMIIRAAWILKENLSPFVVPSANNYVVDSDLFAVVRHPLYGGVILGCIGISLMSNSCDRLIFTLFLAALLGAKADREEEILAALHGQEYALYRTRVQRKFVPFIV